MKVVQSKVKLSSIEEVQRAIIKELDLLGGDRELVLDYIIDVGRQMPLFPQSAKIPANLVPGCLSKVWVLQKEEAGCLLLQADSNTAITKGLIGLLLRVFSGQKIEAIMHADFFLLEAIGMGVFIGVQRSSGVERMLQLIKNAAH